MFIYFSYLLLLFAVAKYFKIKNFKKLVLVTTLLFSTFIVFLTEFLSLFKSLNLISDVVAWSLFSVLLFSFLFYKKTETLKLFKDSKFEISKIYKNLLFYEKALLFTILLGLSLLLFQGLIYPPNNWDSLTYHLSRIMYWISNESVAHFPSHILRHLYQPPLTEYYILHLNLLNGNDHLSNSVQWLFLVFTIIAVWSLLDISKFSRFYKLFAALLIITIPSVEVQASNTKNDIVCAFFVISTLYFCIKSYRDSNFKNFILLSLSIGLGMFTKGTAYLFLAPILLFFGLYFIHKIFVKKQYRILLQSLIIPIIILLINFGHFYRNYKIDHDVLNIDKVEAKAYSNENMNSKLLLSNLVKNVGLHMGFPFGEEADLYIRKFHNKINIPINNAETNYLNIVYSGPVLVSTHEDSVPNTLHLFLILISFIVVVVYSFKKIKKNQQYLVLAFIFLLQVLFFAFYLKWQPWHTRLHIPIFILSIPLIIIAMNKAKWFKYFALSMTPILMFSFYFYFVYNKTRPILFKPEYTKNIKLTDSRYKKYFTNQPQLYREYAKVCDLLYENDTHKIGFSLSDWEYPVLTNFYYYNTKIISINVGNNTSKIVQENKNVDAIITNTKTDFVLFEGKKYINQTPYHVHIWFYK